MKYEGLGHFLKKQAMLEVPMSFAEIERVVGVKLPPSAYRHRPWWSNNASNSVMTQVWLDAGFRTERVDMGGRKLVFRRVSAVGAPGSRRQASSEGVGERAPDKKTPRRHPLFGALKGTFTIEPGYDLTEPSMPEWADLVDEKVGPENHR
ncbi:MAG TPA: hypothetical protein VGF97_01705 [Rhizomicrobium sp.]|jgi:hypothetical protein